MVFGRLTVLELDHHNERGVSYWKCQCECGTTIVTSKYSLLRGYTQSCGCIRSEQARQRRLKHGMATMGAHGWVSRTYRIWMAMRTRCTNPKVPHYHNYGGRGISICSEWNDFAVFLRDMGECPAGMSIDRFPNNDGNYEPGNCRWATRLEQRLNQRKRTHCPQGHPYVSGDIDYRGRQFCRPCKNAHEQRQRARRKQKQLEAKNACI